MANEANNALTWIFNGEIAPPEDVNSILINGEKAIYAYKTIRDYAVFTNKRLIVKDAQGITGKKVEIYSLPYSSINMYSTENSGHLDLTSEVELWTRAGHIKISLRKGLDVRKIDRILAMAILK
ncbi:MAG: PH domain-containing protein [Oscillospiraceae bacterium]|nr:PH domain-containing protein [Oscillospiraceae bacterium]